MALRGLETAQSGLERAEALAAYLQEQLLELKDSSSEKADKVKQELKDAETKLQDAETKLEKAKKELKEAEQKYEAKASVQAGRVQAGASAFAVVAVAFGLQHSRVCFRAVNRFCFLGSCSPLGKDSLVVKLHCVGLQPFGEREGLSEQRALGCCRFRQIWCSSCFADASAQGVSPRLEMGGSACFALTLRSLSRLRLFLFEARLSGYCVREGRGVKGVNPGCL